MLRNAIVSCNDQQNFIDKVGLELGLEDEKFFLRFSMKEIDISGH